MQKSYKKTLIEKKGDVFMVQLEIVCVIEVKISFIDVVNHKIKNEKTLK